MWGRPIEMTMRSNLLAAVVGILLFAPQQSWVTASERKTEKPHWSFVTPLRPSLPPVKNAAWPRGAVDHFVLAQLESASLTPSPTADRRQLLRRLTLDLTGLPPSPQEVAEFVADDSPQAYEKAVDRLLDSPHYGEHLARDWLDAARYADTHGLHLDNYREMWPYRDWVINAFHTNMPYDQFVVEQLAGDLLPNPTLSQMVATGFNRCHVTTNEGGSIAEEVYVRNVIDRVSTTGTAMMGLTLGCAVCHDHKFDPIEHRDFYQLFAFFNSLDGPSMDGNVKHHAPIVRVPGPQHSERLAALRLTLENVRRQRDDQLCSQDDGFARWLAEREQQARAHEIDAGLLPVEGLVIHCPLDDSQGEDVANLAVPGQTGRRIGDPDQVPGRFGNGLKFAASDAVDLGDIGDFKNDQSFSLGAWTKVPDQARGSIIAKSDTKEGIRGYDLSVEHDRVSALFSSRWPGYAIKLTTQAAVLQADAWHHVFVTYDGSEVAAGVEIYVDGQRKPTVINSDSLKDEGSLGTSKSLLLGRRDADEALSGGVLDDVRVYDRRLSETEVRTLHLGSQLESVLRQPREQRTLQQDEMLRQLYVLQTGTAYRELADLAQRLEAYENREMEQVPTTLVFRESQQQRPAYILERGEYDQRGDLVDRRTPDFLPPMSDDLPRNRLGLARWLVSSVHPLTSRVAVNRIWQHLFGTGLVSTSEDFGTQGSPPTHPDLLDWLAVEFRESGWDTKALIKRIVMSATYQQASRLTDDRSLRLDPQNRLLSRSPRFRLDAEVLRDQALAVSGLLIRSLGGPSVKPPQPAGLWSAVGYSGSNTVRFDPDHGADKVHRRSLYTYWKRTAPPPQMTTFDAPSREACTARRERTNTPLQALLLLNDPQYVEAARALAERILREAPPAISDRASWAFEQATARSPTDAELSELVAVYLDCDSEYRSDADAAQDLIVVGELAAAAALDSVELATWTAVANVILNLDEVVTRE